MGYVFFTQHVMYVPLDLFLIYGKIFAYTVSR